MSRSTAMSRTLSRSNSSMSRPLLNRTTASLEGASDSESEVIENHFRCDSSFKKFKKQFSGKPIVYQEIFPPSSWQRPFTQEQTFWEFCLNQTWGSPLPRHTGDMAIFYMLLDAGCHLLEALPSVPEFNQYEITKMLTQMLMDPYNIYLGAVVEDCTRQIISITKKFKTPRGSRFYVEYAYVPLSGCGNLQFWTNDSREIDISQVDSCAQCKLGWDRHQCVMPKNSPTCIPPLGMLSNYMEVNHLVSFPYKESLTLAMGTIKTKKYNHCLSVPLQGHLKPTWPLFIECKTKIKYRRQVSGLPSNDTLPPIIVDMSSQFNNLSCSTPITRTMPIFRSTAMSRTLSRSNSSMSRPLLDQTTASLEDASDSESEVIENHFRCDSSFKKFKKQLSRKPIVYQEIFPPSSWLRPFTQEQGYWEFCVDKNWVPPLPRHTGDLAIYYMLLDAGCHLLGALPCVPEFNQYETKKMITQMLMDPYNIYLGAVVEDCTRQIISITKKFKAPRGSKFYVEYAFVPVSECGNLQLWTNEFREIDIFQVEFCAQCKLGWERYQCVMPKECSTCTPLNMLSKTMEINHLVSFPYKESLTLAAGKIKTKKYKYCLSVPLQGHLKPTWPRFIECTTEIKYKRQG